MREKAKIKTGVSGPSKSIGVGNIFEIFSQLEAIAVLLSNLQPQLQRMAQLLENNSQSSMVTAANENGTVNEKLTELISITEETRETSAFVKRIFTQEKPKKTKAKVD